MTTDGGNPYGSLIIAPINNLVAMLKVLPLMKTRRRRLHLLVLVDRHLRLLLLQNQNMAV
jgi:hypothetical protein